MTQTDTFTLSLPKWYDLHAHFRQGDIIDRTVADHIKMGCRGILAMPNTKPPVGKVFKKHDLPYWSIEEYTDMLLAAGGDAFDTIIVPLYLTKDTTPAMIEAGAKDGILKACKYYPPHGTTGAEFGYPFAEFIKNGVFEAMRDNGVTLCVHGEAHDLSPEDYFARGSNAEEVFYTEYMPRALDALPDMRIVGEHVTTKTAVDFITRAPDTMGATITPQHLLYTVGHLLKGLNYNLYCLPLLKFAEDRAALRDAVTSPGNTKFFAGTDSAPHVSKVDMTACGCAAGCYTGGVAPQVYAKAFMEAGVDLQSENGLAVFTQFLCENGARYYGLDMFDTDCADAKTPQDMFDICIDPAADFDFGFRG